MSHLTLPQIEKLLKDNPDPKILFTKVSRKDLLFATHPDRNPGDKQAEILFKQIEQLDKFEPIKISSSKNTYILQRLITTGDVSDIYQSDNYLVKVSRIPTMHTLLENENEMLKKLLKEAGTKTYHKYLPNIQESFMFRDTIQKRANVFKYEPDFVSLETLHERQPDLDPRHIAWIFKRLLTILGFVHNQGIVHGAVLPCHIQVHPQNHGLQLIGWGHSVEMRGPAKKPKGMLPPLDDLADLVEMIAGTITTISANYKNWYPKEVMDKRPVTQETDLYMAAECMKWLCPNNMPKKMSMFLDSCMLEGQFMRPSDAWQLLEEFDKTLFSLFGKPKYVTLTV